MQRKRKETKQDQPSPQTLLEMPPNPPSHAPRPPRSPPGQQQRWTSIIRPPAATTMRRQRKEINANLEARSTIQEHIQTRGGIRQLRTPLTLRKGNLEISNSFTDRTMNNFPLRPPPRKGGRSKRSTSKSFFQIAPTIDVAILLPIGPRAHTQLKQHMPPTLPSPHGGHLGVHPDSSNGGPRSHDRLRQPQCKGNGRK